MSLIDHLEKNLGQIEKGWQLSEECSGINALQFCNKPFEGANTYTTLGLSKKILPMNRDRSVRQELILSTYSDIDAGEVASFLLSFSEYIINQGHALLRGDVVGPSNPLFGGTSLNSVYSSMPIMFEENFWTYKESFPHTVLVWLIPILEDEANFIKKFGWNEFEDVLELKDPDLLDLSRSSILA